MPLVNPKITWYPQCGRPLAEVLSNTKLAVITGIDENDTLQLKASSAQVIVLLVKIEDLERFDRLWEALMLVRANVIVLHYQVYQVISGNRTDLGYFPKLKYLYLRDVKHNQELENLVWSFNNWRKPSLRYFALNRWTLAFKIGVYLIPMPLVEALRGCKHLKHLEITWHDMHNSLRRLFSSAPPPLRTLILSNCFLEAHDIEDRSLTQAFRKGRLTQLEKLDISSNPIGEAAIDSLLEAISNRSHALKHLDITSTGGGKGRHTDLSEHFVNQWYNKLTNINVTWHDTTRQ